VPVEFGTFENLTYAVPDLLAFALVGVGGGLLGAAFVAMNKRLTLWRMRHIPPTGAPRFLEVLLVTFVISSIKFWLVIIETGGEPAIFDLTEANTLWPFITLGSEEEEAWENASLAHTTHVLHPEEGQALMWLPGTDALRILFHEPLNEDPLVRMLKLLLFAVLEYFTTCLVYGVGVPSGLFVPSLLTGAAFGRLFGEIMCSYVGPWLPWEQVADCKVYALVGSVAFLSGAGRITISLAVILMEATGDAVFGLPLFLASMCARWTGNAFGHGIYDMHIVEMKHIPLLEYLPAREMIALSVRDAMSSDVVAVEQVERVGRLVEVLQSCKHNGFPVLYPGTRRLAGMIERKTLRTVLNYSKSFDTTFQPPEGELRVSAPLVPYGPANWDFHRHPEYEPQKEDDDKRVDLSPYVDRCGYSISDWSSVMSCFRLFRQLGLRHLPVVNRQGNVCGVMTRKDLILAAEDANEPKQVDEFIDLSVSETSSDEDVSRDMTSVADVNDDSSTE
jgi:chloride channel 7